MYLTGGVLSSFQVALYDGTFKHINEIQPNDTLLGEDGSCVTVQAIEQKEEQVYEIQPKQFDSFHMSMHGALMISSRHVLDRGRKHSCKLDDILAQSFSCNKNIKMYRNLYTFSHQELPLDPYILGFWLGHGSNTHLYAWYNETHSSTILDKFKECLHYIHQEYQLPITTDSYGILCPSQLKTYVETMKVKHIPHVYKFSSVEQRRQLFAGMMDVFGHAKCYTFDVTNVNECLIDDICFLASTLGLRYSKASLQNRKTPKKRLQMNSYRCLISRKLEDIPCKLKRCQFPPRTNIRDLNVFGFNIEPTNIVTNVYWLHVTKPVGCLSNMLCPIGYIENKQKNE